MLKAKKYSTTTTIMLNKSPFMAFPNQFLSKFELYLFLFDSW